MITRKGEITARTNGHDRLHVVEVLLPRGEYRLATYEMYAFHRERAIAHRRGTDQKHRGQVYARYWFADPAHADAFQGLFGGTVLRLKRPHAGILAAMTSTNLRASLRKVWRAYYRQSLWSSLKSPQ